MLKVALASALLFGALTAGSAAMAPCKLASWTGIAFAQSCPQGYCRTPAGCCRLGSGNCACM
jgi:hypothetical protein